MADQAAVDKVLAGERSLFETDLSGADFAGMKLSWRNFYKCDLSGADLTGADLRWCNFTAADLKGAKLDGADMHGCRLEDARIDSPKKTATDLLAAIQAAIASTEAHKSWLDLSLTIYEIPGCRIVQSKPGKSAYTLIFNAEDAEKPESDTAEKPFSYPTLKNLGRWPIRFKIDDSEIDLVEPVADIQLSEE